MALDSTKKQILYLVLVAVCASFVIKECYTKKTLYWSLERPQITFADPEYFTDASVKSRLATRADPIHYVTLNYTSQKIMDNNVTVSFFFYQLLSNVYKRSFVDLHYKFCDLAEKDFILGDAFREAYFRTPVNERVMAVAKCPFLPGRYSFQNLRFTLRALVDSFPFQEGRVYINVTDRRRSTGRGHIDFSIKSF